MGIIFLQDVFLITYLLNEHYIKRQKIETSLHT